MAKVLQATRVLDYIHDFGSITRAQAMIDLGIANLPAVIEDLRHTFGYNIVTNMVVAKNRCGETVRYAKYTISEEENKWL